MLALVTSGFPDAVATIQVNLELVQVDIRIPALHPSTRGCKADTTTWRRCVASASRPGAPCATLTPQTDRRGA